MIFLRRNLLYNLIRIGLYLSSMFVLALIKYTVRVPADKFNGGINNQGEDLDKAILEQLNLKFANKVM